MKMFEDVKFKVRFDGFEQPYTDTIEKAIKWYILGVKGSAQYRVDLLYSVDGGNEWIMYESQHNKTLKDSNFAEAMLNDLSSQIMELADYSPGDEG
jgi:hypothetical protein